jgi:hypothetical protein
MLRKLLSISILAVTISTLYAQIPSGYVQTVATVPALANGTYGASWTNLSSSPQLGLLGCVSTFQTTVSGQVNASGYFSTLLADTAQICPTPSTWTFTFTFSCPAGSPSGSFTVQIPVTGGGGTEDISSQITAALPTTPCGGALPGTYVSKVTTAAQTGIGPLNFPVFNTIAYPPPGTGTISAVFAAHPSGGVSVILGCGTYIDNVTITSSYNWVQGNQQCTTVEPNTASSAVFTTQPASNGAALYYNWFTNFTLSNPASLSVDGIDFLDASTSSPHNDYNLVQGVYTSGFVHGLKIQGGNQWNTISNDQFVSSTGNGIDISSPTGEPISVLKISDRTLVTDSGGYGIYANVSEIDDWEISNADIERNGANITSNCAGIYISPTNGRTVNIKGGYYEANCPNSQTNSDANAAVIRFTAPSTTSNFYNATVQGVYFSQAGTLVASGCGILDDAVAASTNAGSGHFFDNEFALVSSTCGYDVKVVNNAAGPPNSPSSFVVGPHTYINSGNGNYLFSGTGAMAYVDVRTTGWNFSNIGATLFTGVQQFTCSIPPCIEYTPPDNSPTTKQHVWLNAAQSAYAAWINDDGSADFPYYGIGGTTVIPAGTAGYTGTGNLVLSAGSTLTPLSMKATGASAAIGYATGGGAGCAVAQGTSRTTGVTCAGNTGAITLFSAAGSATATVFAVTDTTVAATDTIGCTPGSATNVYTCFATNVAAGSFSLVFQTTGGTSVDAPVLHFTVTKGSAN